MNNKLKVAAYVRVSTNKEEQENSYHTQFEYYRKKIQSNPNWEFVGIFGDEGITGRKTSMRSEFMKLIKFALLGKVNLILTKSISRFARNTVDTLKYVRMLKEHNVYVFFEEENINTETMEGELLLTILSSVAQQESENLSDHAKLGLNMKIEKGDYIYVRNIFGYQYNKDIKEYTINEEEAKVIRSMFNYILQGNNYSQTIKKLRKKYSYLSNINSIDYNNIKRFLTNEQYIGNVKIRKNRKNDLTTEEYYITNHHKAIISQDVFNKVQEIINNKKKPELKRDSFSWSVFTRKLRCGFCGNNYTIRCKKRFVCSNKHLNGIGTCMGSISIPKEIIKQVVIECLKILSISELIIPKDKLNLLNDYIKKLRHENLNIEYFDSLFEKYINYIILGDEETQEPTKIRIVLKDDHIFNYKLKVPYKLNINDYSKIFDFNYNYTFSYIKNIEKTFSRERIWIDHFTIDVLIDNYDNLDKFKKIKLAKEF